MNYLRNLPNREVSWTMAKLVEEWWQEPGEGDQAIEAHHLEFETLDKDFDYAISTSVLYLIDELSVHAREVFERLKSGGIYFAGYEDYRKNGFKAPYLRTALVFDVLFQNFYRCTTTETAK